MWNDPINLMSYVTFVFQKLFGYSLEKATELMLDVHQKGRAVVSSGTRGEGGDRRLPPPRARPVGHDAAGRLSEDAGASMARRRRRIDRKGPDRYTIDIPHEERALLRQLLPQLRELISAPPGTSDERVRRLFPTAYPDDVERDAEYQRFMRDELVTSRVRRSSRWRSRSTPASSTEARAAWRGCSRSTRSGSCSARCSTSARTSRSTTSPTTTRAFPTTRSYGYLSMLLDEIVTALSRGM